MRRASDADFLERALELAKRGEGHTRPNPPVGAVIVKGDKIIGEGWHKKAGGDHAEVAAIKNALRKLKHSKTQKLKHCTLYVTLEPCSKPGRVGACTDAIIAAGIKRVVYAVPDPNPKNRGKARRALAKHGIECVNAGARRPRPTVQPVHGAGPRRPHPAVQPVHGAGPSRPRETKPLIASAEQMIAPFAKHVTTGLPYVTVKLAMSLDGKICDDYGNARWISSAESRKMTGRMREHVDAIMVGAETVRKDNPSLLSHGKRNDDLVRVVVTRTGKLPKNAQIFTDGAPNETRVFRVDRVISGPKNPVVSTGPKGPVVSTDPKGPVVSTDPKDPVVSTDSKDPIVAKDLKDVLRQLGRMGVMHVLCEGGLKLARSLADAGLVDRWISITAPIVIGSRHLKDALRLKHYEGGMSDPCAGDCEERYERCSRA